MKYVLFAAIACLGMSSAMAAVTPTPDSPPNDGHHDNNRQVHFECEFAGPAWKGSACEASGSVCIRRHEGHDNIVDNKECENDDLTTTNDGDHRDRHDGHLLVFCTDGFRVDARAFSSFDRDRFEERSLKILSSPRFDGPWDVQVGILIDDFVDDRGDRDGDRHDDRRDFRARFLRGFDGVPPDPMWGRCRLHREEDHHDLASQ